MTHDDSGWRRVLTLPWAYETLQRSLGSDRGTARYVAEVVRPQEGARVLDIGCGPGTIVGHLPGDIRYTGYDMNPAYIDAAQRRYGDRAEFSCGRVGDTDLHPEAGQFDVVTANGLIHHLSDVEVAALTRTAREHLKPGGVFVTLDPVRVPSAPRIARLLVGLDRGRAVRTATAYRKLLSTTFETIEDRVFTDLLRVPYTHYVARCQAN